MWMYVSVRTHTQTKNTVFSEAIAYPINKNVTHVNLRSLIFHFIRGFFPLFLQFFPYLPIGDGKHRPTTKKVGKKSWKDGCVRWAGERERERHTGRMENLLRSTINRSMHWMHHKIVYILNCFQFHWIYPIFTLCSFGFALPSRERAACVHAVISRTQWMHVNTHDLLNSTPKNSEK